MDGPKSPYPITGKTPVESQRLGTLFDERIVWGIEAFVGAGSRIDGPRKGVQR